MKSMTTREKYKKTDKGITLIALVVTIIVLLILAGVSIMMLTGQNGILRRAEEAGTNTAHAEVYEILNLQTVDYITESKLGEYSGSLVEYLLSKGYIETMEGIEGYIIKVEALLGQKGKYGNGTDGKHDVYKLEEVIKGGSREKVATREIVKIASISEDKKYEVVYYDKQENRIELGNLLDEGKPISLIEDITNNPDKYQKPEEQTETEDVGIAEDGTILNMDLWTYRVTDEENKYFEIYGDLTGYNEKPSFTLIPDENNGYKGISITTNSEGKRIARFIGGIPKYLKIDNIVYTLISFGQGCFTKFGENANFDEIKIDIPDSVVKIGSEAFRYCQCLEEINIPNSVVTMENRAFESCDSLHKIELPDSLTEIGDVIFESCDSLLDIKIPKGITTLSDGMFWACSSLTTIEIPINITTIVEDAFCQCDALTTINYRGTREQWELIEIIPNKYTPGEVLKDGLEHANIVYNYNGK